MLLLIFIAFIGAIIGFELPYEIVENRARGKFVIARRDILPGELVLEEKEPLMYFTEESVNQRESQVIPEVGYFTTACSTFKKLPDFRKRQIENLYAPTDKPFANGMRMVARNLRYVMPGTTKPQHLPQNEMDIFVKVSALMEYNSFFSKGGYYLFNETSRLSHSCAANCVYNIVGPACKCYAVSPIKAGEELTITYKEVRDFEPTHKRRELYAAGKDFTCHCPRCDAFGDDTRQFDCFDPACDGVMMVHQPLSKTSIFININAYEGVEYVEPHLLPCTVCHRASPADYQTKMLALEDTLPALVDQITNKVNSCLQDRNTPVESWESMLREIERYKLPRRHMKVRSILELKVTVLENINRLRGVDLVERKRAALECIEVVQNVFPHPRSDLVEVIRNVCNLCGSSSRCPVISLEEEKALRQKVVRMQLIMHGRENRDGADDNALAKVMSQLPAPQQHQLQNMVTCAFCEESPLRAAMKRSRCGKCKQVTYCSVGCQKAHWPLHKKCFISDSTFQ